MPGLSYMSSDLQGRNFGCHRDISLEETGLFTDLLAKLLDFQPDRRWRTGDVLEHAWFKLGCI